MVFGTNRQREPSVVQESPLSQSLTSDPALAARHLLEATRLAVAALEETWDEALVGSWTRHVTQSKGRLVLSGMGKSGLVAQKIAATLASTGCPSFYLHPADALHGDLGMVMAEDTVLILSNSGESEEILRLLPSLIRLGVRIGAITSRADSRLGQAADWCFTYTMPKGEGCPLNFAPMASTTLQLVWGDLLAAYHMVESGFTLEHFAQFHPAGNLGARLLKVKDLMHTEFPRVSPGASLVEALEAMTKGKLGMTTVMEGEALAGIISDGDIRRALQGAQRMRSNPLSLTALNMMTPNPVCTPSTTLAVEVARSMEARKITFVVVRDDQQVCGVVHIHDLFAAKVI
jgi:arabinose-5-phosphate isomerase